MVDETAIQATARFVVGFGTEEDHVWRDYNLDFCGTVTYDPSSGAPTVVSPVENSGYSLGSLQWDFGQGPSLARPFVDSFTAWSNERPGAPRLTNDPSLVAAGLSLDGSGLRDAPDRALWKGDVDALSAYVRSPEGSAWVNRFIDMNLLGSDARRRVTVGGKTLGRTLFDVAATVEGTVAGNALGNDAGALRVLHALGMKVFNQSPNGNGKKLLQFLGAPRTPEAIQDWPATLPGAARSGAEAAVALALRWNGWSATLEPWLRRLLDEATRTGALANPIELSRSSGEYVLARQAFETPDLFDGFAKAVATGKDYVSAALFTKATGAIAIDRRTGRPKPGMLAFKGKRFVWDTAGNAFRHDGARFGAVDAKTINLLTL